MFLMMSEAVVSGLDSAVKTAISNGFTSVTNIITDVVKLGVPALIGILAISGGARYGIKWIRSIFFSA